MHGTSWSMGLPPELLREISCRLHDTAAFVRFHAVCKPWRGSHEPTTTDYQFMPWLLAPSKPGDESLKLRCVFSGRSYHVPRPISATMMNGVTSAGNTNIRYFTDSPLGPTLHESVAGGAVAHLPLSPHIERLGKNPGGIIHNDGTLLLYSKYGKCNSSDLYTIEFSASLLHPGNDEWTFVQRTLETPCYGEFYAMYHAGKIIVTMYNNLWLVVMTPSTAATNKDGVLVHTPLWTPPKFDGYFCEYTYVLESRGELLWASVHIKMDYPYQDGDGKGVCGLVRALWMSIHVLEEVTEGSNKLQWVRKDGKSLNDRLFFLGWPNSFAMDASRLGVSGGFAYFLYCDDQGHRQPHERCGVFKYNLIDNMTEFIEWLPQGWDYEMCTWLIPQPTIAPIHQVLVTTPRSNNMIHIKTLCP
ncbi:hypothetical protein ACQJBY_025847 [Aegilops geniculata]